MIGLFLGEKDLPNEIVKKIEKKKIKYFIIDLTKNGNFLVIVASASITIEENPTYTKLKVKKSAK